MDAEKLTKVFYDLIKPQFIPRGKYWFRSIGWLDFTYNPALQAYGISFQFEDCTDKFATFGNLTPEQRDFFNSMYIDFYDEPEFIDRVKMILERTYVLNDPKHYKTAEYTVMLRVYELVEGPVGSVEIGR